MKRLAILVLALTLLTLACGSDEPGEAAGTPTPPPEPDQVILTIGFEGGFAPVEAIYDPLPQYVLFSDGRLVYQGPVVAIYPGLLLPNLQVAQLDDDQMFEILTLVEDLGLPSITDERNENLDDAGIIADAPDTVFTYFDEAGEHRLAIYALGASPEPSDPQVVAAQRLVDTVNNLSATAPQLGEYEVERLHIVISDGSFLAAEEGAAAIPWPLTRAPSQFTPVGFELQCSVFEGNDAEEAMAALQGANQLTLWEESPDLYRPIPRPLFPGEVGCPTP